jgi:hypothetical protein
MSTIDGMNEPMREAGASRPSLVRYAGDSGRADRIVES